MTTYKDDQKRQDRGRRVRHTGQPLYPPPRNPRRVRPLPRLSRHHD